MANKNRKYFFQEGQRIKITSPNYDDLPQEDCETIGKVEKVFEDGILLRDEKYPGNAYKYTYADLNNELLHYEIEFLK